MTIIGDVSENSTGNKHTQNYSTDFEKERDAHLSHIETLKQENLQKQKTIEVFERLVEKLASK